MDLGCFPFGTIMNNAAINLLVYKVSLVYTLTGVFAKSQHLYNLNFSKYCQTIFQREYTNLFFHIIV